MALRTPPSWMQNGSHPAENDRLTTQGIFRTSGVLSLADLTVTQSTVPAMSVSAASGWGVILGTYQALMGTYQFTNDAATTLTIATADPTNPRIDLICVTVSDAYYTGASNQVAFNVVTGTPAGSPVAPATPTNSIVLAQVAVAALATTILNASITDVRTKALSYAGLGAQNVTASLTAVANMSYFVPTLTAAYTITLPAICYVDDEVRVYDAGNNAGTNNITIAFNGLKFQGATGNTLLININRARVYLKYTGSTDGWMVF